MKATKVLTIKKIDGIPLGSVCYVTKVNKKSYRVNWSSMAGTYSFTIPKSKVEIIV